MMMMMMKSLRLRTRKWRRIGDRRNLLRQILHPQIMTWIPRSRPGDASDHEEWFVKSLIPNRSDSSFLQGKATRPDPKNLTETTGSDG